MSSTQEATVDAAQSDGHPGRVWRWLIPRQLAKPSSPALLKHQEERARDVQNRGLRG